MRVCFLALIGVVTTAIRLSAADVPPNISAQPMSQAVNTGFSVAFNVTASGTGPLRFQWRLNGAALDAKTNATLTFSNVQPAHAGDYTIVVTNNAGAVTSHVAQLRIVSSFTRVTNSTLARGGTRPLGAAWGDFNNDGWVDLVAASAERYLIHTNRGDGTFHTVTNRIFGGEVNGGRTGMAWADFDNDGHLDLAIGGNYTIPNTTLYVYRNRSDGQFARLATNLFFTTNIIQYGMAWGDYDNDGFVDLLVPTTAIGGADAANNLLFRNQGNGAFVKITNSLIAQDGEADQSAMWADFDNDGDLDLFATGRNKNRLYRNYGGGLFTIMTNSPVSLDGDLAGGCAWGDYDNDGDLDLFVTSFNRSAWLYRNDGGIDFTRVTNSPLVLDGPSAGCIWLDFDNDGWLDLVSPGPSNFLYHNSGDGSFLKVTTGPIVGQTITSWGNNSFASADANRDGFADLLWVDWDGNSQFFQNEGNSNSWLSVRCDGRLSNRAGIGAKVRVRAALGGTMVWQMREIGGGGLVFTQNEPVAQFGLGDATNAQIVRIEWPSGVVQEWRNMAGKQFLTMVEPAVEISPRVVALPAGTNVTFTLAGTLDPSWLFQWRWNGAALAGETNDALAIASLATHHAGSYSLLVSNPMSGESFLPRSAIITGPIVLTQHPQSQNIRAASNVTFQVVTTGLGPIAYQWRFHDSDIPGATNATLTISNVMVTDEGDYSVSVSNSYGAVVSSNAVLVVLVKPVITVAPLSQSVVAGGSVTFSASATGHPFPLTYRWLKNGVPVSAITIADTNCFFTLTNVQAPSGPLAYRVSVTNLAGSTNSTAAVLSVLGDTDGDGLPDEWEIAQGLDPNDSSDATQDSDGDGMTNLAEYRAGTDPKNRGDRPALMIGKEGSNASWVQFAAVSNRTYTFEERDSLSAGHWSRAFDLTAAPTNRLIQWPTLTNGPQNYFRLRTPASR